MLFPPCGARAGPGLDKSYPYLGLMTITQVTTRGAGAEPRWGVQGGEAPRWGSRGRSPRPAERLPSTHAPICFGHEVRDYITPHFVTLENFFCDVRVRVRVYFPPSRHYYGRVRVRVLLRGWQNLRVFKHSVITETYVVVDIGSGGCRRPPYERMQEVLIQWVLGYGSAGFVLVCSLREEHPCEPLSVTCLRPSSGTSTCRHQW